MELSRLENYIKSSKETKQEISAYVNYNINHLVLNKAITFDEFKEFFQSKVVSPYICLSYKEGQLFEFCCLLKKDYMNIITFLVDWANQNNKEIPQLSKDNALISAVSFNKIDLIKYLLLDEKLGKPANISYANYSCVLNSMPKNGSPIKEQILKFFIFDMNLEKTKELVKVIKKANRADVLKWFESRDLTISLTKNLSNSSGMRKKNKI